MAIQIGENTISKLNLGEMGIKRVLIGDTEVYNRPGGYIYLELDAKEVRNNG